MAKDRLKAVFMAMPLACLVLEPRGKDDFVMVDANQAYYEITNSNEKDLKGELSHKIFPKNPEHLNKGFEAFYLSLRKVMETGKPDKIAMVRFDLPIHGTSTFEEKYWNPENVPILDHNGKVEYILHTVQDITARVLSEKNKKNALNELNQNQQQTQHFISENPDGLYSLDLKGNFTSANEGIAKIAELPLEELLKMDFLPFCAPHDKERILGFFQKSLQGESVKFEGNFITAKGKEKLLHISLIPMKTNGEIKGSYGIAKDVTEYRKIESMANQKKKFLEVNTIFIASLLKNELKRDTMKDAFEIIGKALEVDRMYYFESTSCDETNETLISQKIEWVSKNISPQADNPEMQNIPASKLKQMMGTLGKNIPFTAIISELPEGDLKDIFLDQDIKSMLLLPIFFKNELHGFIGFDDCTNERVWTQDEINFSQNLAHNLAHAFEKRLVEAAVKRGEEELKKSEQKFRALVQEGSDLLSILDTEANYTFLAETTFPILGIHPEELMGRNAFDFIHPEDAERIKKEFDSLQQKKQIKLTPFRFIDGDGNWRWIETTITNMMEDPAVQGMVSNGRDVTSFLNQAREIKNINERYRLAATATNDLIYDWDLQKDSVKRFHGTLKEIYGYPSEEIDKKEFWDKYIHPEDKKQDLHQLKRALANPNENYIKTEYRFKRADGSYAMIVDKGYIIRNNMGKPIRLVGAASDISEITAKEEALKIANKRFKLAMKASNEMIWDWDIVTDKVDRGKTYKEIYGYNPDSAAEVNSFWRTKIAPKDEQRIVASLQAALDNPEQIRWREEYRFIRANGETAHIVDRGYIIRDEKDKAIRMVGAVLDVTESRRMIRKIKKQNELLKKIAWEQSHLVRAPLVRIKGLLDLLELQEFEEISKDEIISHMHASADELDEIVRKIVTESEKIEIT